MKAEIEIQSIQSFDEMDLISRLKDLTMLNAPTVKPYQNAYISIEKIAIGELFPHQRYVLLQQIKLLRELKWQLEELKINMFDLNGFVRMKMKDNEEEIDLLPPIVEEWIENNGKVVHIINDGMHRLYMASLEWLVPKVVFIRGVPKNLPFYAFPIANKDWNKIEVIENTKSQVPNRYLKKWHRIRDNKILYRNFNSVFKNVGQPRGQEERN